MVTGIMSIYFLVAETINQLILVTWDKLFNILRSDLQMDCITRTDCPSLDLADTACSRLSFTLYCLFVT